MPRGNYPMGAEHDKNAPFNEPLIPEHNFDVNVTTTLSKDITIKTDAYLPEYDDESGCMYPNTENTVWVDEYEEKCYTIPDLLKVLAAYIKDDLERCKGDQRKEKALNTILEACQGWKVEECDVVECF